MPPDGAWLSRRMDIAALETRIPVSAPGKHDLQASEIKVYHTAS